MQASQLDAHVAIVTGAARGIGAAYARGLADAGATVVVVDIQDAAAQDTAEALGAGAISACVDVSDRCAMDGLAADVQGRFGRIDILVNNAAIFADDSAGFAPLTWDVLDGDMEAWRKMRAVNVEGVLNGARAVAPYMRDRGYGRIINQASVGAFLDQGGIYALSKLEVASLTRLLAFRLAADGITVNAIAPGLIATEAVTGRGHRNEAETHGYLDHMARLSPSGRVGQPDDLLSSLLFFASPASAYVNGQVLLVDGGWVRHI